MIKHLKGSTLVEVLTTFAVVSVVFSLSVATAVNIVKDSRLSQRVRAEQLANTWLQECMTNFVPETEIKRTGDIELIKTVVKHPVFEDRFNIYIQAMQNGCRVFEIHEIVQAK